MLYLPYAVAIWIFLVGLYGLVTTRNFIHAVLCLSVMQSSTYLLLLIVGYRHDATAPVFSDVVTGVRVVDPVVHALTLTDIVVGATVSALLLAFTVRIHAMTKTVDPQADRGMRG